MKLIRGFFMAWGNFCIIPCPSRKWDEAARKHMLLAMPIIGLMIGFLWYGLFMLLNFLEIHISLKAALMTAYPFVISGFIHLDGFMDCNDAILSRRPLEDRQKILKDPHVGAFAVVSAILLFMVFFGAMWAFLEKAQIREGWILLAISAFSRFFAMGDVLKHKPLATSQYSPSFNSDEHQRYTLGITIVWMTIALLIVGLAYYFSVNRIPSMAILLYSIFIITITANITIQISGNHARKQLGGMSGDVAGYSIVWSELMAIIALAII